MAAIFFGFMGDGYRFLGDSIDKTFLYSNLHWLHGSETDEVLKSQLDKLRSLNQFAVVVVTDFIFKSLPIEGGKLYSSELLPNARENLTAFYNKWSSYKNVIVALFLIDEPYRVNQNHGSLSTEQVTLNLNTAALLVKQTCPYFVTMLACAGNEYDRFGIPKAVNWLGMYRYSYNTSKSELIWSYFNLFFKKGSEQKIVAIADSFEYPGKQVDEDRIISYNDTWKWLIRLFGSSVIAVCPYLYQTNPSGQGANAMPKVLEYMKQWGSEIIKRFAIA